MVIRYDSPPWASWRGSCWEALPGRGSTARRTGTPGSTLNSKQTFDVHCKCTMYSTKPNQPSSHWSVIRAFSSCTIGPVRIPTLPRKFHLCIPFWGIARPQSHFPHWCVCERFIYFQDRSTPHIWLQQNRQRPILEIHKSLTDIWV